MTTRLEVIYEAPEVEISYPLQPPEGAKAPPTPLSPEVKQKIRETVQAFAVEDAKVHMQAMTEEMLSSGIFSEEMKSTIAEWRSLKISNEPGGFAAALALLMITVIQGALEESEGKDEVVLDKWYTKCENILKLLLGRNVSIEDFLGDIELGMEEEETEEIYETIKETLTEVQESAEQNYDFGGALIDQSKEAFNRTAKKVEDIKQNLGASGAVLEKQEARRKEASRECIRIAELCKKL